MNYRDYLAVLAIIIGTIGYVPYFRDIVSRKTKPHAFSWLVWCVLTGVAFFGQLVGKGGAGAWVTGFTALVCLTIFILALQRGHKDFPLFDWLCLIGAGIGLLLWLLTDNPLLAIILITAIDMLGFIPTFRKSISKPNEETAFTYSMSCLKFAIAIIALQHYSWVTVLYPASLVLTNGVFVPLLLVRRAQLRATLR